MKHKPLLLVLAMTLSGCNLIPEYQRPDAPIPQAFPQDAGYEAPLTGHVALIGWRTFFKDPAMHRLVDLALANNRDLRKAALNVAAYRAQYRIQGSALLPQIEMDGTGGRSRTPADMSNTGQQVTTGDNSLQVGLTSYELDVWGRIRSLDRNALETYLASEETQRSVQIGLVAEVAVAYLTWETDRQLLSVTRSTLENYRHNLELIQASSEAGTASDLDVRQARTLVDSARGQVQAYTRQVAQDINALRLLLGTSIPDNLPETDMEGQLMAEIPAGMPANLLQQRPDIRAAEHQLLAANANIGAARAASSPALRSLRVLAQPAANSVGCSMADRKPGASYRRSTCRSSLVADSGPVWTTPKFRRTSVLLTMNRPFKSRSVKCPTAWQRWALGPSR